MIVKGGDSLTGVSNSNFEANMNKYEEIASMWQWYP